MNHKRPPIPVIVIVLLIVGASIYFLVNQFLEKENDTLAASGTIESTVMNVSPEMAGKVKEVLAEEGQTVESGEPLLALDDSLLAAQRVVAQSSVESARSALLTAQRAFDMAQAQYDANLSAARAQQGAQRLADWSSRTPNYFEQPLWYFNQEEQITAAKAGVESARLALEKAQAELEQVTGSLASSDFIAAETRLSSARVEYLIAKAVDDHAQVSGGKVSPEDIDVDVPWYAPSYKIRIAIAKDLSGDSDIVSAAQDALDAADAELDDAEQAYHDLLSTDAADTILEARAKLAVAKERYEVAQDTLTRLQTGENSPQMSIAAAALEQAKAGLHQAEKAVQQAEANLSLLDTQMEKLTVYAPLEGVILTRNVEPGEFVQPGATAFAMANLDDMTITVYVPEDRYGQIKLGQQATVTVDSYPGETFSAEVIHIADQAEFTPRNVQTVEGRSATVYAIKLKVDDEQGRLKIGMPADVVFLR